MPRVQQAARDYGGLADTLVSQEDKLVLGERRCRLRVRHAWSGGKSMRQRGRIGSRGNGNEISPKVLASRIKARGWYQAGGSRWRRTEGVIGNDPEGVGRVGSLGSWWGASTYLGGGDVSVVTQGSRMRGVPEYPVFIKEKVIQTRGDHAEVL
eukprot:755866-Hanusia_phi.AAC.6